MKKKLFVLILAGLLLIGATACSNDGEDDTTGTGDYSRRPISSGVITDDEGNIISGGDDVSVSTSEVNPTFTDIENVKINVISPANIRTAADATKSDNIYGQAKAGDTYTADGESKTWYRIKIDGNTYYITKKVTIRQDTLDAFVETNDEVKVIAEKSLNVRSLPSSESYSEIVAILKANDVVKRISKGAEWSKVEVKVKEGETTKTVIGYVKNTYIESTASSEATTK